MWAPAPVWREGVFLPGGHVPLKTVVAGPWFWGPTLGDPLITFDIQVDGTPQPTNVSPPPRAINRSWEC